MRLRRHVGFLTTEVRPRGAASPENLERAANYIEEQFRRAGARTSRQRFVARKRSYSNVIGAFGPDDFSVPLLAVGAHYDAFAETGDLPGADDNASGTAGLVELARLLGSAEVRRPVLLVAFANEEPPFFGSDQMGSAVHAAGLASERRAVRGMISLEMKPPPPRGFDPGAAAALGFQVARPLDIAAGFPQCRAARRLLGPELEKS